MLERGVTFVELFHESWDQHATPPADFIKNCADTDRPCAALVMDLKQRGLLEDTIIIWGGQFGRTPMAHSAS
jgi:hypothetical protein